MARPAGGDDIAVMGTTTTTRARPGRAALLSAVELAIRAPSIHNTQPWRWRIDEDAGVDGLRIGGIDLFADRSRQLATADRTGRGSLVSCGAALFQAQLALAAAGWRSAVTRLPNPFNDDHLATILVTGQIPVTDDAVRLAAAARRRRTDRRPFTDRPVGEMIIDGLRVTAERHRAFLHQVNQREDRLVLAVAVGRADEAEAADPRYRAELARWSGRTDEASDGIPATAVPDLPGRRSDVALRPLPGSLQVPAAVDIERPRMFVIGTETDSPRDRLLAGEALAEVLLEITDCGLAASPYTQPLEVPGPSMLLRRILAGLGEPQIVLRVGWPGPGEEPPLTPRRPVADVLLD